MNGKNRNFVGPDHERGKIMKSFFLKGLVVALMLVSFSVTTSYAEPQQETKKGGSVMNTYVIFFSFTQKGIENIKDSPARVEAAKKTVKALGGEMKAFYAILGSKYDTLFIVEAPDDSTVARMVLSIASKGSVSTETHRLFNEAEYSKIISSLP